MNNDQRLCTECGEPQTLVRKTVHYPQSGLSNVRLQNVPVWKCANSHEEVEIPKTKQLHEVLAQMVLRKPVSLVGPELRFLRRRINLSAKDFASRIGLTPVRLSQLEHSKQGIARRTDLLVRLYVAAVIANRDGTEFPRDLAPLVDELETGAWDLGEHMVRHNDNATANREWEEATT